MTIPTASVSLATPTDKWNAWAKNPQFDRDMRMWTKFGSPTGWFFSPLDVVADAKTGASMYPIREAIAKDTIERLTAPIPTSIEELMAHPAMSPTFSATRPDGTYRWAPQQFSINHLVNLYERYGEVWAGWAALTLWGSYYVNKGIDYLRDGGNPAMPYSNGSRTRTVACAIKSSKQIHRIMRISGAPKAWLDFVESVIWMHVGLLHQHFPLYSDPKGDHLTKTRFLETWQHALLWDALMYEIGVWPLPNPLAIRIAETIEEVVKTARIDDLTYHYDVAVSAEGKIHVSDEMMEKVPAIKNVQLGAPKGAGSVNAWILGASAKHDVVPGMSYESYDALRASAKKEWTGLPWVYAGFVGEMP